ncbi:hypothetical protein J2X85_003375 [Microbacterium trichothecenolyticum]|uniref:hypothetical protein n=1 Tax=Microbacterium trichothecenolyticum TaxID=69370 RepID=UPI002857C641|nr:hypothetical protein [Microbacterium trichothecenolyticum]MDR7186339.1 hypothetical protein [Microbacterium trichothecenolyticum]
MSPTAACHVAGVARLSQSVGSVTEADSVGVGVGDGLGDSEGDADVVGDVVGELPPLAQPASTSTAATNAITADETLMPLRFISTPVDSGLPHPRS